MVENNNLRQQLNTAVLFLVFNRPDTTKRVFEAIRQAKPPRLYVAADGPRSNREGESRRVALVREIATAVDWPCEVYTLFREINLGCQKAVSSGIDWFFENEEQGIILEDDCLPHQDFFQYCETLLCHYANDQRVWVVTGDNFQNGKKWGDGSYYFSRYNHVWGWATWKRAWIHRDMDIKFWPKWKASKEWNEWLPNNKERQYWSNIFDKMHRGEIDTWDYPWTACVWYNSGLTVTPNVNLVSNIGFGIDATHTNSNNSDLANIGTLNILPIKFTSSISQCLKADKYVFNQTFGVNQFNLKYYLYNTFTKINSYLKNF